MTRLLNLFRRRRDRLERDLDRELRYHMDRRVEDLIKDGLSEPEAWRRANIELGGVPQVQEAVRDTWIWRWLDALLRDVRDAMRSLTRSWGFTVGAGAVLALAIGANTAIFSVVNTVLLQPLAYPDAERIVSIETLWSNTGRASQDVSGPDFLDWQAQNNVFEKMAVSYGGDDFRTIVGDRAMFANVRFVSADFFAVFGQTASAGRLLMERDIPVGDAEPTVAVVRYHWAVAQFGSAEAAIGKMIGEDNGPLEIVGVAAPGFRYPGAADLWVPWLTTNGGRNRSLHNYQAVGKLHGGVDLTRAQAQMRTIGDTLCAAISREPPEDRDGDSTAAAADREPAGDVMGADERRGRRVAHRVRQYREPPACAGRGEDARDRAPRRARRRPRPCGAATAHRELCARRSGRTGWSGARVTARAGSRGVVTRRTASRRRSADGHDRPPVRTRALDGIDGALRARAGAACLAARPVGCVEAGRLEGDGIEGQHSAPLGAGRR